MPPNTLKSQLCSREIACQGSVVRGVEGQIEKRMFSFGICPLLNSRGQISSDSDLEEIGASTDHYDCRKSDGRMRARGKSQFCTLILLFIAYVAIARAMS